MCSRCGGLRAFRSTNRVRLNANGRKLDAWLIYKCTACDKTWNRPIFERRTVRYIDPAVLAALQANDPGWTRWETFNLEALRRKSRRIDEFTALEVRKELVGEATQWTHADIELSVPFPVRTRLDRLFAAELNISRSRLRTFHETGLLRTHPPHGDILRRRIGNGTRVMLDRSILSGGELASLYGTQEASALLP